MIKKNEYDMEVQLKEINLSMNTRLALEKQVDELEYQLSAYQEEIGLLKQDKRNV